MAPALTEPLSPTENITSSVVSATSTPNTRSNRKLESIGNKNNSSSKKNNTTTSNNILKPTQSVREKRNRSGGITTNQTPTSSKRLTRLRDNQPSSPSSNVDKQQIATIKKISKTSVRESTNNSNNNKNLSTKNEQMGLNTAPLNNKNKILNNSNNNKQNLDTIDNSKDSSTAQLLADLTNEAITAEICLRNQLKDVNLVKTSGDPSSPIQQDTFDDTDIVVLKVATPTIATASSEIKTTTAHMEAQFKDSLKPSKIQDTLSEDPSTATVEDTLVIREKESAKQEEKEANGKNNKENVHKEEKSNATETVETEKNMVTALQETPLDSPNSVDADTKKPTTEASKLEILSVQELPPVSTDSTMTASEVEDNLEERLSQLDGTAIDSPPPNHDIDSSGKISQNSIAAATPPQTPTHQQTLTQDLQVLQQQLQPSTPPPVSQQVSTPQQTNCFTPQSTSSITSVGTGNIPQSFIKDPDGGAAELEDQDIEEVFKVLKGFEGGTTSDLNVCDLNVLFNEVYMKINETELSGNAVSSGSVVSGISGNTQSLVTVSNPSIQLVKPTELEEGQMEIEKRQQQMQRKMDFLMRRLRKLQARYMCKHTSEEIAGLFEWSTRQMNKGVTNTAPLQNNECVGTETIPQDPSKYFLKVIAARPPASDWKDAHESLVPANQITVLLRKIESVANAQQLCTTPPTSLVNITHKKTKKALMEAQAAAAASKSAASLSIYGDGKAGEVVVATLEENVTDELMQVAGLLRSEMCEVQKAIDSDATESSSGGESADEMVTYNNTHQQTLPITKRAAWRYSRDRAAIASRWSWLLSQISDLEIKIRQHSELHQEIVRSKGPVTCVQTDSDYTLDPNNRREEDKEELMGSVRTLGYLPSQFRKRKLIQTTNIHTISKKAARPSTIKCGCQWPLHPCALCTGRLDPTAPRDLPDTMMMTDRIALLDSGYHPVLSFRENVNNALHFEAIAKQPEWQQRVMRCQAKNIAKSVWRAEREAVAAAAGGHHSSSSKKYNETALTKRRYIKKKDRINNEEKTGGGKSSNVTVPTTTTTTTGTQPHAVTTSTSTQLPTSTLLTTSSNDIGNGTATLSSITTTPTTPLVANKGMTKSAKKQHSLIVGDGILKKPVNAPLPPLCMSNTSSTATSATTTSNNLFIHQTSDCLPINHDQFNPNQTPSSLISSTNSSKSNKHRKLSSSTTVNSLHYNHLNNNNSNLHNGDSSYMLCHENWVGAGENFNIRSRTSSPTHGSSGNNYHKYERSLDRKNRSSYDIDNIVIPYSVAAATRVEILPYKEIPTPKWRVIEIESDENTKLKNSKSPEFHTETSDSDKPTTNGHICHDDRVESEPMDKENNSENGSIVKSESVERQSINSKEIELKIDKTNDVKDNSKTLKDDIKDTSSITISSKNNNRAVAEEVKGQCNYADNNVDKRVKEPQFKKLKIEQNVIEIRKEKEKTENEEEEEEEEAEDKLTLQNILNCSMEGDEDISDDTMFLRHEKALTEERRKFQTYLKFPWSTRSRANRRIDSRAESSGANTPDPSSPAPQTPSVGGGDQESIPSPLNPATPLNLLDTISEPGDNSTSFLGVGALPSLSSKRYERRRTTSTKRDRELERRSSTPDSKELTPPYEPLTFPLTDEQFEELMRAMPSDHSEDCKRFDDCYLPGGGLGGILSTKYPRTISGSTSKRTSRSSTLCGDATAGSSRRRVKSSSKNMRPILADDSNISQSHENGDILLYEEEEYDDDDDYPKHHLAPNDDHLTADSVGGASGIYDEDDIYGDQYDAYVGRQHRKHRDSDAESSEEEPFQDDDPNDPEWRGETEERLRKRV